MSPRSGSKRRKEPTNASRSTYGSIARATILPQSKANSRSNLTLPPNAKTSYTYSTTRVR